MRKIALTIAPFLLLAACASPQKTLTVDSDPQGAVLIERETGQRYVTPVTLRYNLDRKHVDANGCHRVRPFIAQWASGTTLNPPLEALRLCGDHVSWTMTIKRPKGAPGLERDLAEAERRQQQIRSARIQEEIRRLEGQAEMDAALETLGRGIGCAAAGGCSQDSVNVHSYAPAALRGQRRIESEPSEVPPWALMRDPLDFGTVCDVDGWGRSHCGLRK